MTTFYDLGLPENVLTALDKANFVTPTPIQEQSIPVALSGQDVLGSAQTGTGKTAAFVIPMIVHLMNNPDSKALVLLPTRELSQQVLDAVRILIGAKSNIKRALIIGGDSIVKQFKLLKENPRIIIGTPGRINDHLVRKSLKLDQTDFIVLDETDRMLDMGFGVQLDEILKYMPKVRQTLMFSATMPKNITALSQKYLTDPVRIRIGDVNTVAQNVEQKVIATTDTEKYGHVKKHIAFDGTTLIFVKTKYGADRLAAKLSHDDIKAESIHGDLKQAKRQKVMSDFKKQRFNVLVATDIAARGLDISHIERVINYDLPHCPEDYIHRIGRTARAGASGMAINLLSQKDYDNWTDIVRLLQTSNDNIDYGDMHFFVKKSSKPKKKKDGTKRIKKVKKVEDNPYVQPLKQEKGAKKIKSAPVADKVVAKTEKIEKTKKVFDSDKPKKSFETDRPKKSFGSDKPRKSFDSDKPRKSFGSDKPKKSFETDRPRKSFGSDKPRKSFESDRPRKSFDSDKPRKSFGLDKPRKSFGSDKPRKSASFVKGNRKMQRKG